MSALDGSAATGATIGDGSNNGGTLQWQDVVEIAHDAVKGRVLVAKRRFEPGQIIFLEDPLVAALCDDVVNQWCVQCCLPHASATCALAAAMFPKWLLKDLNGTPLLHHLAACEAFGDVDRARCFVKAAVHVFGCEQQPLPTDSHALKRSKKKEKLKRQKLNKKLKSGVGDAIDELTQSAPVQDGSPEVAHEEATDEKKEHITPLDSENSSSWPELVSPFSSFIRTKDCGNSCPYKPVSVTPVSTSGGGMRALMQLTGAHVTKCGDAIQRLLSHSSAAVRRFTSFVVSNAARYVDTQVVSSSLTSSNSSDVTRWTSGVGNASRLLAVLNTNSHELADVAGSGLFLLASMMEHNCAPNCNFTSRNTQLWVTAVAEVKAGDHLSIDYECAEVYRPTAERKTSLLHSHEFVCSCDQCTVLPDLARAFVCGRDSCSGVVSPIGEGDPARSDHWKCLSCGTELTEQRRTQCLEAEKKLTLQPPSTLDEVDDVIAEQIIHSSHHILFWALHDIGRVLVDLKHSSARSVWERVITCVDRVLPPFHDERCIFNDQLAQICVLAGDIKVFLALILYRHLLPFP